MNKTVGIRSPEVIAVQKLSDKEFKLFALALDRAAAPGEVDTAAKMLIKSLRQRYVKIDDLIELPNQNCGIVQPQNCARMTFGKYKGESLTDIPANYLVWALANCDNMTPNLRYEINKVLDI